MKRFAIKTAAAITFSGTLLGACATERVSQIEAASKTLHHCTAVVPMENWQPYVDIANTMNIPLFTVKIAEVLGTTPGTVTSEALALPAICDPISHNDALSGIVVELDDFGGMCTPFMTFNDSSLPPKPGEMDTLFGLVCIQAF